MTIPHDSDQFFQILDRYLAGEATAAEATQVREWLAEDAEHARILEDVKLIRRVIATRPPESPVDVAWHRVVDELSFPGHAEAGRVAPIHSATRARPKARRRFSPMLRAAAAVVALVGGTLLWQAQRAETPQPPQWHVVATQAAQRTSLRLSDGTQIVLAPGSRLRYAADFGEQERDVHLEGEAYFEVVHDETRPFRVHTSNGVAEDLGTAFVVSSYQEQNATEVVVVEGLVALNETQLNPGDLGRVDTEGQVSVQHNVDVQSHVAWTYGVLVFDATPLREVALALERWYDIEIELTDAEMAARPLTATFRNEPPARVMERVALTLGLRIEQDGRSIILSPDQF